jgi:hypothetical protein
MENEMSDKKFVVRLTRADGYEFNTAFDTIIQAREFIARAATVTFPGETITLLHE